MQFFGQVAMEELGEDVHFEYGEGIYYAFACTDCGLSAASYQQT